MRNVVLLVSMLTACVEPRLVPCGDLLCPAGSVCVAGEVCATNDQIAACEGVTEGGSCSVTGGAGHCIGGVCIQSSCGNGVVDPEEECDDANQTSGDGCRADCRKLEVCGDGVVDDGEGCDDANENPVDACDACRPTSWLATAIIGGSANATSYGLATPARLAVDRRGNVYVAATDENRVRRIDTSGVITTIAGVGTYGFSGDGGPATSAELARPLGLAVDGLGNVYVADTGNNRVRRIDSTGIIRTVAGTGTPGFGGDAGAATAARLDSPQGVAVDGLGDVYIADTDNMRVRRVDVSGTITTVAGTGSYGFSGDDGPAISAELAVPADVALDAAGRLYISETDNHRVRRVTNGTITTFAGSSPSGFGGDGGPATSGKLRFPEGIAVDGAGNVYICDVANHRIRRVDTAGTITTIAGSTTSIFGAFAGDGGPATSALLNDPRGVAVDAMGTVYLADSLNNRVRRIDAAQVIDTFAGTGAAGFTGDGGSATGAQLFDPWGVAVTPSGALYVADTSGHRIRRIDPTGVITTVAGTGVRGYSGDGGAATAADLQYPYGVAVDAAGAIYIADNANNRIRRVDPTGTITTIAGTGVYGFSGDGGPATSAKLAFPEGVAVDGAGTIYIADTENHRIRKLSPAGIITTVAGNGTPGFSGDGLAATAAMLNYPTNLTFDGQGNLYIADTDNNRVRKVDAAGVITTVAGVGTQGFSGDDDQATSAELYLPRGLVVDASGALYIGDVFNGRIRRVATNGIITTIAGLGDNGLFDGDGGPATNAELGVTRGLAIDTANNLYIADTSHARIRKIATDGVITTVAGAIDPEGVGPVQQARLADPRALVVAADFMMFAGGSSGTVQTISTSGGSLVVGAGRYPQPLAIGARARFRGDSFGDVNGVAYDPTSHRIYLAETTNHRIDVVTMVDPADVTTWTIAPLANASGTPGFAGGAAATARFRSPSGLHLDAAAHALYVADTGNHAIRVIDLVAATVSTFAGTPATLGFYGDGGAASAALLYAPQAVTRCPNGDVFIADTGNHRIRRVAAGTITTVLGVGVGASSGEGEPATTFPVNAPLGLACDTLGNLFVTSTTSVRLVPADASGVVDGSGTVQTIYGAPPRDVFPASVTRCLTGLAVVNGTTLRVTDACTGLLVELTRQ